MLDWRVLVVLGHYMTYLRLVLWRSFLVSGCGLNDSDVTNFDLTLPEKSFSVDASGWQVNQRPPTRSSATSCSSSPTICLSAATTACPMNCTGRVRCRHEQVRARARCQRLPVIDLVTEKPELNQINDEPVIKVTIDSVRYRGHAEHAQRRDAAR